MNPLTWGLPGRRHLRWCWRAPDLELYITRIDAVPGTHPALKILTGLPWRELEAMLIGKEKAQEYVAFDSTSSASCRDECMRAFRTRSVQSMASARRTIAMRSITSKDVELCCTKLRRKVATSFHKP